MIIIKQEILDEIINKSYNKSTEEFKSSLSENIKKELFKKYNINSVYFMEIYYKEFLLVEAIINEMITTLELDK